MKFLHISDLHIGKRVNEFSMIDDQQYILSQILSAADAHMPDAVLIAGDVYDKSVPPAEAVTLLDDFLCALSLRGIKVFVISGNHDSPERIAFGARIMSGGGVYMSQVYGGSVQPVTLTDRHGDVDIFMLPFIKPVHVRRFYPDAQVEDYNQAVACAVENMELRPDNRSVLITHQFVTGGERTESEEISVGGSDNVDAGIFRAFDYVALGHLHKPQHITRPEVRYCGSPLKYSFSEAGHTKSVTVVTLGKKGEVQIEQSALKPRRDLRDIKGGYEQLVSRSFYGGLNLDDYYRVTLTDEQDVPGALPKLRAVYPNIMQLAYDNSRTRAGADFWQQPRPETKSPAELFGEFFRRQNGRDMDGGQSAALSKLIQGIWEDVE